MDPHARIGDADRERASAELSRHYTDGRLDHEEYDERLDAIWSARTAADLAVVFHDLPKHLVPAPRPAPPAVRRERSFPWLPVMFVLIGLAIFFDVSPAWLLVVPIAWFVHRRGRRHARHGYGRRD